MYFRIALVTIWLAILVISIILKSIKSMKPYWQDWLRFCRLLISFQYVVTLQVLKRFRSEIKTEGRMILSATQTTHLKPCKVNEGRLTYDEANWVISPIIYHFLFWCLVILWEMMSNFPLVCGEQGEARPLESCRTLYDTLCMICTFSQYPVIPMEGNVYERFFCVASKTVTIWQLASAK